MFTFVSSGSLRFTGRFAQRAFYSLASPGARWTRREFLPRHSRVAAGDKTPTKPALLITAGVTGPHLHPGSLHRRRRRRRAFRISQKGKEKNRCRSSNGHRRDRLSL